MKTTLLTLLAWATTLGAFGQGTLNVGNSFPGIFRAPIYAMEPVSARYFPLSGQSSLGVPSGTTEFHGALLQGTGYTFAVYYGAATVTYANDLHFLVSTTFRTAAGNDLPAGLVRTIPDVVLPGMAPGARAMLQVRVWDNQGGLYPTYNTARFTGTSGMFLSEPLGGGILLAPDMIGWTSFNITFPIPEPSPFLLAGLGAGVFGLFRWRRSSRAAARPRKRINGVLTGCLLFLAAIGAQAQGRISIENSLGTEFRYPIYAPEPNNPYLSLTGQSAIGIPSGTTVYSGPLLQGTGYTFSVYYGAATVTDPSALTFLVSTTFRTATGNVYPAGLIRPIPEYEVPGVFGGYRIMFQVRVWDNQGGVVTSWDQATTRGASAMVLSDPLVVGALLAPDLKGWASFNLYSIPEPSPLLLAGFGALVFGMFGWRRTTTQGSR